MRSRTTSVFVNCPFDQRYQKLFDALVFSISFCRFTPRSALEINDSGQSRLSKIVELLEESAFSIHDISRVQLEKSTKLPRFNMPFELGIAIGMKHLGRYALRDHQLLVLDADRFRYQQFASDLAGVDITAHHNRSRGLVRAVRDFLAPHQTEPLPDAATIHATYEAFLKRLPVAAHAAGQSVAQLTYVERLRHIDRFLGKAA